MATLEQLSGGVLGVGGTVALREFADIENGQERHFMGAPGSVEARLTTPSAAFGLGSGALAGALWYADKNRIADTTPFGVDRSLWASWAVTALASGVTTAIFPKHGSGSTGGASSQSVSSSMAPADTAPAGGGSDSSGDYAPAGGNSGSQYSPSN